VHALVADRASDRHAYQIGMCKKAVAEAAVSTLEEGETLNQRCCLLCITHQGCRRLEIWDVMVCLSG
jgi:hypothetical protein